MEEGEQGRGPEASQVQAGGGGATEAQEGTGGQRRSKQFVMDNSSFFLTIHLLLFCVSTFSLISIDNFMSWFADDWLRSWKAQISLWINQAFFYLPSHMNSHGKFTHCME